jgi:protein TonB
MFNILESTWDRSARRSWTTLASFGFQAMAVSLLLLVPLIWVQGPPKLSWLKTTEFLAPPTGAHAPPDTAERHQTQRSTNTSGGHIVQPPSIPNQIAILNEQPVAAAPNIDDSVPGGTGLVGRRGGIWRSIGNNTAIAPPPPTPAPTRPIKLSHWAEGNLIYRVQPAYPELARQVRIQGTVQLHAIISKTGTIEHLAAVSGHPMLIPAALNAVRQWRYRPYLLNGEPVEVETEITVNFILAGN